MPQAGKPWTRHDQQRLRVNIFLLFVGFLISGLTSLYIVFRDLFP